MFVARRQPFPSNFPSAILSPRHTLTILRRGLHASTSPRTSRSDNNPAPRRTKLSRIAATISFPYHSPNPTLNISSLGPQHQPLSVTLRPSYTLAQVYMALREDFPSLSSITIYKNDPQRPRPDAINDGHGTLDRESSTTTTATSSHFQEVLVPAEWQRWSNGTTVEEVLRDGFRTTGDVDRPSIWAEFHDQLVEIHMPTFSERTQEHFDQLREAKEKLAPLLALKTALDKDAGVHTSRIEKLGLVALVGQWAILARLTYFEYSWDEIEPIGYFVNGLNQILAYIFFMAYRRNFSVETLSSLTVSRRQLRLYESRGFNVAEYERWTAHVERIQKEIDAIRDEYQ